MAETEPLRKRMRVRCTVAHAFAVFTERVDQWWPPGHRRFERSTLILETSVGGRFYERAEDGQEVTLGAIRVCEPPHRIVYSWHPGAVTGPTLVEVRFRADGEDTLVEVTHSEGDAAMGERWPERVGLFERAWSSVLPAFITAAQARDTSNDAAQARDALDAADSERGDTPS